MITKEYLTDIESKISYCRNESVKTCEFDSKLYYTEDLLGEFEDAVVYYESCKKDIYLTSASGGRVSGKKRDSLGFACAWLEAVHTQFLKEKDWREEFQRKAEIWSARQHLEGVLNDNSMALDFFKGVKTCQK